MILSLRLGFFVLFLAVWWMISLKVPQGLFASPYETLLAGQQMLVEKRLWTALLESMRVYFSGTLIAAFVGIFIGGLMGSIRTFGRAVDVYVYALAATPRVAFVPMIIVLLGLGVSAKVFIVFLGAVMPVIINTYKGVQQADENLIEMARSTGAGQARIVRHIIIPGAMPFILAGLRLSATLGLINTIVAELYTAVSGLGGLLNIYGSSFRMAEYFVVVIILALLGVVVNEGLRLLEQRMTRWQVSR